MPNETVAALPQTLYVMNLSDIISIVASVASFVLAVLAIWLTMKLFNMSTEHSEKIKASADIINVAVIEIRTLAQVPQFGLGI